MNDPKAPQIEIEEQRNWLIEHRKATGASWAELAKRINIPQGTLSQFGSDRGYRGDEKSLAEKIYRYRQMLAEQAQIDVEAPEIPSYFQTETSAQLEQLLKWAQRGRIVVAAMNAGLGKTTTARHYAECFSNVYLATMSPSTAGVNNMQQEVLEALGERDAVGTPQKLSRRIRERVRDQKNPLIIIDEAQHLSEKAIEEIRSWHDATGVGIALFGNVGVMQRLTGGTRSAAFAQLFSRVSMPLLRTTALRGDADALALAWNIHGKAEVDFLRKIVTLPGGLRGATMALELASMLAAADGETLQDHHLQDAWAQLSTRRVTA